MKDESPLAQLQMSYLMHRVYWSALVILLAASTALGREWTDITGRFTIEGDFVEVAGDRVRLRKPDGRFTTIRLNQLSEADRVFVQQNQAQQQLRQPLVDGWLAQWMQPYESDTRDTFDRGYQGRDIDLVVQRDALWNEIRSQQGAGNIGATIPPLEQLYRLIQSAEVTEPHKQDALGRVLQTLVAAFVQQKDWQSAVRWQQQLHQIALDAFGETDWRTTDQRTSLSFLERILESGPEQREQLNRGSVLLAEASRQYDQQQRLELVRSAAQSYARWLGNQHPYYADCLAEEYRVQTPTEEQLRRLVDVTRQALGQVHPTTITRTIWLGNHLVQAENLSAAQEVFSQAITALQNLPDGTMFDRASYEMSQLPMTLYNLAERFRTEKNDARTAHQLRQQIVVYYQKANGPQSWQAHQAQFELSRFEIVPSLSTEKLQQLDQLNELRQKAVIHGYAAEYTQALQSIETYRTLQDQLASEPAIRKLIVDDPRLSAIVAEEAANYAFRAAQLATAISYLQYALARWEESDGPNSPGFRRVMQHWIQLYEFSRDRAVKNDHLAEAMTTQRKIIDLEKRLFDDQHWRVINSESYLGDLTTVAQMTTQQRAELKGIEPLLASNDVPLRDTIRNAEEARQRYGRLLGDDHLWCANVMLTLADHYDQLGHDDRAESYYQEALQIRREKLGEYHPEYAAAVERLARLYNNVGQSDQASQLEQRAQALWRFIPDFVKEETHQYVVVPISAGDVYQFQDARANTLVGLAEDYYDSGDFVRAENVAQRISTLR